MNNKKSFYGHVSNERKTRENVGPLKEKMGDLVTQDLEKAKVLYSCFSSVFTINYSSHTSHRRERQGLGERTAHCKRRLGSRL